MSDIQFRSDMGVQLVGHMGDDSAIAAAARVSTVGAQSLADASESAGLINFLAKNRHGSPFEHVTFTFLVECPIFVAREFMRHRIASYNEESGRYKQLDPVFYVPDVTRPLQQVGKAGAYEFVTGTEQQQHAVRVCLRYGAREAYAAYKDMLDEGVAREVARMVLPLNIYTSFYVTMNARGLMNFLSLRTKRDGSHFPSYPQQEIEMVAEQMEEFFAAVTPLTHKAFNTNGRVAP
ncbi:thymidylate synthase [Gordonia phage Neville]|uniref:ThyX-like thymidylate synthase n=2 Tax=Nevillevirus TaxID=3044773 RepID=A0A515MH38_9CAUD|nr:thymidylate synthase [Gordonia phage Neville]YP_010246086.1 thymidylate synthase [Gordonia phage Trax]AXQ64463.1 ThyX-like thymidylate synthase [Gordonia phage Neville]QDM55988.1 ThyX-like thymidylate synthase [Gordonia phage Trax]